MLCTLLACITPAGAFLHLESADGCENLCAQWILRPKQQQIRPHERGTAQVFLWRRFGTPRGLVLQRWVQAARVFFSLAGCSAEDVQQPSKQTRAYTRI